MTQEEFDSYNEKIDTFLFGPKNGDLRDFASGEFFMIWRYSCLREVKEKCSNRNARNLMRKWVKQRSEELWIAFEFPEIPDDWNYWKNG